MITGHSVGSGSSFCALGHGPFRPYPGSSPSQRHTRARLGLVGLGGMGMVGFDRNSGGEHPRRLAGHLAAARDPDDLGNGQGLSFLIEQLTGDYFPCETQFRDCLP